MATTLSSTNGKRELKMEFESLFQAPERASAMFLSSFFRATVRPPFFPASSSESKRLATREKMFLKGERRVRLLFHAGSSVLLLHLA